MADREQLQRRFENVRQFSVEICRPLAIEDYVVQPFAAVSPPKWHLAHSTWFFEELVLKRFLTGYQRQNEKFRLLFNSYYKTAGAHWRQSERGQLSRPSVAEVLDYRTAIDKHVANFLQEAEPNPELDFHLEVGLNHEEQHQELLFMDIKAILAANPLHPSYATTPLRAPENSVTVPTNAEWSHFDEGIYEIGNSSENFAFDNERPAHKTYIYPFLMNNSLVTNREYREFIEDGGYQNPSYWLSAGWDWVQETKANSPLYWHKDGETWHEFTLHGMNLLQNEFPVCHINYFEAAAFAQWSGCRLPTEPEAEVFLHSKYQGAFDIKGKHNVQSDLSPARLHPNNAQDLFYNLWFWTSSHYSPYPRSKPFQGMLGEYNGKFMCNQFVQRAGSFATPTNHLRTSYRNFFLPEQQWMFSGIRLARDSD